MKRFEDVFIRIDRIHERDRQTDGMTPYIHCLMRENNKVLFTEMTDTVVSVFEYSSRVEKTTS